MALTLISVHIKEYSFAVTVRGLGMSFFIIGRLGAILLRLDFS